MKFKRKLMGLTLAVCMAAGLLPAEASAAGTDTGKAIRLVEDGSAANIIGGQGSNVYYGTYQQSSDGSGGYNTDPIKWRVLSNEEGTQPDEGDKLFLLADQNLDVFQYHVDDESVTWAESTMRSWLNGYSASYNTGGNSGIDYSADAADSFLGSAFSGTEKSAIPKTAIANKNTGITPGGAKTDDYIFLLSLDEVQTEGYGFADNKSRQSINTAYAVDGGTLGMYSPIGSTSSGWDWWLRSPGHSGNFAAVVDRYVGVYNIGNFVNFEFIAVRPAFKLNLESVLFTSDAEGGKIPAASGSGSSSAAAVGEIFEIGPATGDDWKMTVLDKGRQFAISNVQISGDTVTFSYSGAKTGINEYISAVIMTNGELTHYGRVLELDGTTNGADGDNVSISIPSGMTLDSDTELYLFNEQYNGGEKDDTKLTDYASALCKAEDTTAPSLTAGEVTRTSDASATVKFTSNEAGTYYYEVVDSGASQPIIDTTGVGTACDTNEQTITLDNLTAGAKDIYIAVKDGVGNVSAPLKIGIPAYIPPSHGISASPSALDFGTLTEGYASVPEAQTVIVENTGNQSVTISLPASTSYVITAGTGFGVDGTAKLDVSGTAQFTVQPKTGLAAGNYDETLTISGTGGAETSTAQASVALSMHVQGGTGSDFRPAITEGAGGVWKKGSKDTLSFRSDAGYADFLKVQMDGNDVAVTDYEVREGSTIVTLKSSYLESLSVGVHTLAIVSQTGTAETTFTIQEGEGGGGETPKTEDEATKTESGTSLTGGGDSKAGSDTSNTSGKAPGTGDDSLAALWGMLALFAGVCSAEIVLVRRKKIK